MKPIENKITPFITFCGQAQQAVEFYVHTFPNSKIISLDTFQEGDRGVVGDVLTAVFELNGQQFMAMDMEKEYYPTTSWAISFFYHCETENEFDQLFASLSTNGTVLMGPDSVETSSSSLQKCAWVTDAYGVTWQLVYQ